MSNEEQRPLLANDDSQLYYSTYNEGPSQSNPDEVKLTILASRLKDFGKPFEKETGKVRKNIGKITYTWNDVNVYTDIEKSKRNCLQKFFKKYRVLEERKQILKNVCGAAYPGELLAVLGSSGSGKTTLLNALTFQTSRRNVSVTGLRCINGIPVTRTILASQSAYVQQDDLFIGCLTVREHLRFQALVRMDRTIDYKQRMLRVEEVISELGLSSCAKTTIGIPGRLKGISGGEMKRLSFASEVLTNPALMFCDEPTSGLDSFMAQNVVQVLKGLAQTGKTVVCTIHQPSSELYAMFDKLLLMAEGRVAFLGTPEEAALFFSELGAPCPKNYNPADYYIQLLAVIPSREESCKQAIDLICDQFESSDVGVKLSLEASTLAKTEWNYDEIWTNNEMGRVTYKANWCSQFRAVLWRSWLSVMKDPMLIKVRLLQTVMVALLIGIVYFGQELTEDGVQNINGVLFVFLTNMTFQNVFAVINVFCAELPIFLREHRNGMYRVDVYFLCKTLAETPIFVLIPVLFTSVSYYMIGLNSEQPRFFITIAIVILIANVSTSFGYFISCASNSVSMALSIGPPVIIPFLLFGGFFLNTGSVPIYFEWLSYLSWFRYGNEALLINQWNGVENITCLHSNSTCPRNGHIVLESLNFSENDFIMDFIGLGSLIVGFRLIAFSVLLIRSYKY